MKFILTISVALFGLAFLCLGNQSATIRFSKYSLEKGTPQPLAHFQTNSAVTAESCVRCHDCSGTAGENSEILQGIMKPRRIGVENNTYKASEFEAIFDDTVNVKPEVADRFVLNEKRDNG